MKTSLLLNSIITNVVLKINKSYPWYGAFCFSLSWLYAISSQIIIPLPFNHVPLSIQPLPVLLASFMFGWAAVHAYVLYLVQGALGAPIFAGMLSGMARLLGPTGGYLFGFLLAAVFIAWVKDYKKDSLLILWLKIHSAMVICFAAGLLQLACFVPGNKVFALGLYPFFVGDFIIKASLLFLAQRPSKRG